MGRMKLIIFLAVIFLLNSISAVSCNVIQKNDCLNPGVKILYLSELRNAHVSLADVVSYGYVLCCNTDLDSCGTANAILRLSSDTNAHVGIPEDEGVYPEKICLKNAECVSRIDACPDDYPNMILSLAGVTNAHSGDIDVYARKICCKNAGMPIVQTEAPYWASISDINQQVAIISVKRSKLADSNSDVQMVFKDYAESAIPSFLIKYADGINPIINIKTIEGSVVDGIAKANWAIDCQNDLAAKGIDVNCDVAEETLETIQGDFFFEIGFNSSDNLKTKLLPEDGGEFNCPARCEDFNIDECEIQSQQCPNFFYGPIIRTDENGCRYNENGDGCELNGLSNCQQISRLTQIGTDATCTQVCDGVSYTPVTGNCDLTTGKFNVTLVPSQSGCEPVISWYDCANAETLPFFDGKNFLISLFVIGAIYCITTYRRKK